MTNLSRLIVSLTKHNAHKIASLLKDYKAEQILGKLGEVHAEEAQAKKNLSVQKGNKVPAVWGQAKEIGDSAIDALVLVGIVFSHYELIEAIVNASDRAGFSGRIERGNQLKGKAYTNFARVIDQLGFATKLDYPGVSFTLKPMFEIPGFGPLVGELLGYKLDAAGWDRTNSIANESIKQGFHKVFGVSATEFERWVSKGAQPTAAGTRFLPKDEEFFQAEDEGGVVRPFVFKEGHTDRAVDPVVRIASAKTKANQLHNDIQNKLHAFLQGLLGAACVGTEVDTGCGTSVDVVTKQGNKITFYEIKTSPSVRTNIRQALPQLLEYAFWPTEKRASELVIVSHLRLTPAGNQYLEHLREQFGLPITYRQFDLENNHLV